MALGWGMASLRILSPPLRDESRGYTLLSFRYFDAYALRPQYPWLCNIVTLPRKRR